MRPHEFSDSVEWFPEVIYQGRRVRGVAPVSGSIRSVCSNYLINWHEGEGFYSLFQNRWNWQPVADFPSIDAAKAFVE